MRWWPWIRKPKCPFTVDEIDRLGRLFIWIERMPTSATISKDEAMFLAESFHKVARDVEWRRDDPPRSVVQHYP